jgi:L,D-transpeptidase ErfK/SrfK
VAPQRDSIAGMRRGSTVGRLQWALLLTLAGCVRLPPQPEYNEAFFSRKPLATFTIPTPRRGQAIDTVIGELTTVKVIKGDTLLDIGRWYDVGYDEMAAANPGIDMWIPREGTKVTVPTAFVLPCCTYTGVVVNVPELRVYYYRPGPRPGTTTVQTFPAGLGRDDTKSPRGKFHVIGKTVDPTWVIPESIRREHIRENGDRRRSIAGGAADNPLGRFRLELNRSLYRIHGTSKPWGIGMQVTHGCVQLYPEDIEHLYPLVPIGTPVEFTYQPVKVGQRRGRTFVEVHADIYDAHRDPVAAAVQVVRERGLPVDREAVRRVAMSATGVPEEVGRL